MWFEKCLKVAPKVFFLELKTKLKFEDDPCRPDHTEAFLQIYPS